MKFATILLCFLVLGGGQSDAIGFDTIVGVKNTTSGECLKVTKKAVAESRKLESTQMFTTIFCSATKFTDSNFSHSNLFYRNFQTFSNLEPKRAKA
jgi:hypothetical protein